MDDDRKKTEPERQAAAGLNPDGSRGDPGSSSAVCSTNPDTNKEITQAFKDEKVSGNLVRFYAILSGKGGNLCTPADLGIEPKEESSAKDGGKGRLMLCADPADGNKVIWNVIIGTSLKPSDRPSQKIEDVKKDYETGEQANRLKEARKRAGL